MSSFLLTIRQNKANLQSRHNFFFSIVDEQSNYQSLLNAPKTLIKMSYKFAKAHRSRTNIVNLRFQQRSHVNSNRCIGAPITRNQSAPATNRGDMRMLCTRHGDERSDFGWLIKIDSQFKNNKQNRDPVIEAQNGIYNRKMPRTSTAEKRPLPNSLYVNNR